LPQSKSHSTPGVSPVHGEKALCSQRIREEKQEWRDTWGSRRGGPIMNVVDRRLLAVIRAGVFDEVLQLSHVAGARIDGEGVQRLGGDGIDAFASMLRLRVHEVAHQQGIIRSLLIQGGHDDGERVQPIIQILS
jgi:hypothetical protein